VPTAEVLDEGSVRLGLNAHDALPGEDGVVNHLFSIGFAPGLELGGRIAQPRSFGAGSDLSFNAKLSIPTFDGGPSLAIGGQDLGGEAQNYRSRYAVATWPWRTLRFTAGYDWGPDVLDGTLGGIEWRPWPFLGAYAEYDTQELNPGLKLQSPPLWAGLRIGANAGWRAATDEVEGGIELSIPLGRRPGVIPAGVIPSEARDLLDEIPPRFAPRDDTGLARDDTGLARDDTGALRAALEQLGFEAVRTGSKPGNVLAVSLENRRYNHSSADAIGLALGTVAARAPAQVERIELTLSAYGVPQVTVATGAKAYRDFLRDGAAPENLLEVRYSDGARGVSWHNRAARLAAPELVIEPVLRTFVATEFGVLDAGLGARARLTAPLGGGAVAHLGVQAPLALSDDFHDGRNFAPFAPEGGLDLLLIQYAHKLSPEWTWLWSVGRTQVVRADLGVLGLDQAWTSPAGRHRLGARLMTLDSGTARHNVALGGYTWFDAARRYSAGVTGGRFYAGDSGFRLDLNRYFGDTIAGLFLKVESEDNMAGGFQLSVPLTPRRDAAPRGLQVKGPRRWGHSLQSTLNLADRSNSLKPLLLYEPAMDFDLARDFLDSGRLGPGYLREQLPRMREAYQLWGS
jgi:hypothetical protein